ncbi:hypothetical protein HDU87_008595 [Geranomyces variabilis]|uniref:SP-RING-type domain-containing protein n=1 Tax=Geranomyces variabilis TaxID=109894 RepID=A0AAD5TNW1_9FUNG|nr:hypothetical protein HDU87_008595 [Geranomyces variabilis]
MSYYGSPYEFYPVHSRYPPGDGYDMRDLHPHDHHMSDMHPDDAWCYGPPPTPTMYSPHHSSNPHFSPFDAAPYDVPPPPHAIVVGDRAERAHISSNLGNSFAIPKGTRNAMHRVITANDSVGPAAKSRASAPSSNVKTAAQAVGATTTATAGVKGTRAAAARLRPINVKFENNKPPPGRSSAASPKGRTPTTATTATPCSPSQNPSSTLIAPPTWKRMFEAARARAQGEAGVAGPVVELASQVLNKRCVQVNGGIRKFVVNIDSTILRRGVLSSRSNEGMTVALYLFQPARGSGGDLISTDTMLCKMKVSVDDTQLLPATGMSNGVQINLLPALTPEKFEKSSVTLTIEAKPEDFAQGLAMICLRRLDPQMCPTAKGRLSAAVPSLLRRHSAPSRPPYPLIAPAAAPNKRSSSTLSASPGLASPVDPPFARGGSACSDGKLKDHDMDVEVGDQIVSLICPVALTRIRIPGKGRECKHAQSFDLETFTKLSMMSAKWKCSVCGDPIEKTDLIVSEPFLHYLAAYPEAERCIVRSNGSHAPYAEPSAAQKRRKVRSSAGPRKEPETVTVVVDLCDDAPVESSPQGSSSTPADDSSSQATNTMDIDQPQSQQTEEESQAEVPVLAKQTPSPAKAGKPSQDDALAMVPLMPIAHQLRPEDFSEPLIYWVDRTGGRAIASAAEAACGGRAGNEADSPTAAAMIASAAEGGECERRMDSPRSEPQEDVRHCNGGDTHSNHNHTNSGCEDIATMSPEERAALIHRIFADAAEEATCSLANNSNSYNNNTDSNLNAANGCQQEQVVLLKSPPPGTSTAQQQCPVSLMQGLEAVSDDGNESDASERTVLREDVTNATGRAARSAVA